MTNVPITFSVVLSLTGGSQHSFKFTRVTHKFPQLFLYCFYAGQFVNSEKQLIILKSAVDID